MNEKDEKYIESLVKELNAQPVKKQRSVRNILGVFLLLIFPCLGTFGFVRILDKYEMEAIELLTNEMFGLGFLFTLLIILPLFILVLHLKWNGDYDDLKKNEIIVELYKKSKEKL